MEPRGMLIASLRLVSEGFSLSEGDCGRVHIDLRRPGGYELVIEGAEMKDLFLSPWDQPKFWFPDRKAKWWVDVGRTVAELAAALLRNGWDLEGVQCAWASDERDIRKAFENARNTWLGFTKAIGSRGKEVVVVGLDADCGEPQFDGK